MIITVKVSKAIKVVNTIMFIRVIRVILSNSDNLIKIPISLQTLITLIAQITLKLL
jgi:hypothetical protein